MTDENATHKAAMAHSDRRTAEPAYDLFDSLRQARLNAEQSWQKRQPQAGDQPHEDARFNEEYMCLGQLRFCRDRRLGHMHCRRSLEVADHGHC